MVLCTHCKKIVPGVRPYDGALACDLCGRILENFNFSTEVTFVKNAAGQSQASGNVVRSVQSGISSSRERRTRIARDEFMNLRDALGIGDERDDVIDMAARFFKMAMDHNFTKGRRTELVQASCLYLTCREKNIPYLLIDFSSYLRVSVYELGSVYLQLCELLYIAENKNYEKLVDPSIFIPRFSNIALNINQESNIYMEHLTQPSRFHLTLAELLKGTHDEVVVRTARDIIASMKRDWIQTGRKPSGICGAALYTAALSHGIKCSKTDIVNIVHICEATLTKRLIEFGNTESGSLSVLELTEREERERDMDKRPFTMKPKSTTARVLCSHQDCKPFGYGLCEDCYKEFMNVSGGIVGGSDPPAFQRAEKERMEKAAREEEKEGGVGSQLNSERESGYCNVSKCEKRFSEKSEETKDGADENVEASDESDNSSDIISDGEMNSYFRTEKEKELMTTIWEAENGEYVKEQEAKKEARKAALNVGNSNCPEHARQLAAAVKAAVSKSRKEKRQRQAEEEKNAPPPATPMEAVRRSIGKKSFSRGINLDALEELLGPSSAEKSPKRSKIETVMEEKKEERSNEHEDGEAEEEDEVQEDEEGYAESYNMNTDFQDGDKFYEDEEEEEDGYDDLGLF